MKNKNSDILSLIKKIEELEKENKRLFRIANKAERSEEAIYNRLLNDQHDFIQQSKNFLSTIDALTKEIKYLRESK